MKAKLISVTDKTVKTVEPANGKQFSLKECQGYVGGLIEIIGLNNDYIMVINEEGKLIGLDINTVATRMAREAKAIYPDDYIVGNVIWCHTKMVN